MTVYRLARPDDEDALVELMEDFVRWNAVASGEGARWFTADWRERCRSSAREVLGRCIVAVNRGTLAGYATFHGDQAQDGMFVREAFQGLGIGRRLFDMVSAAYLLEGVLERRIEVFSWNTSAIDFYKRLGAVELERRDGDVILSLEIAVR